MATQQLLKTTLSSLLARTRRWVQEPDPLNSRWIQDFVKQCINSEYRLLCAELYMTYEGFFTNIAQADIVANQVYYPWPGNMQKFEKLELVRTDGRTVPIGRYSRLSEVNFQPQAGGDGYFPKWRPVGGGFVLEPGPNESVTNGMQCEYLGIPVELTDDGDILHPDFPALFDELIVLNAAIALLASDKTTENPGVFSPLQTERERWRATFERFIDNRFPGQRTGVVPFVGPYENS